jgi:hypothetical protein
MGRLFFIRDWELISSNISMDCVDVLSGDLKDDEYLFKNDIRNGPLTWYLF